LWTGIKDTVVGVWNGIIGTIKSTINSVTKKWADIGIRTASHRIMGTSEFAKSQAATQGDIHRPSVRQKTEQLPCQHQYVLFAI